jgi:glyceraldehyde-3-phosphate dehydrogenase/erythrose-4-phosphate dehydrogenase
MRVEKVRVAINGYGVIGKRVAEAVRAAHAEFMAIGFTGAEEPAEPVLAAAPSEGRR